MRNGSQRYFFAWHIALLIAATAVGTARAEEVRTPAIDLRPVSDLDDPQAIRPARPLAAETWLRPEDFPADTFVTGKWLGLNLRLLVDASGKVTGCTNIGPATDLATTACARITERARFVHAIDATGTPKPSERVMSITFYVAAPSASLSPGPPPPPPGFRNTRPVPKDPAVLNLRAAPDLPSTPAPRVSVAVSEKGRVTGCRILQTTTTDAGDAALCRRISAARFEPARDPEGRKVAAPSLVLTFKVAP